MLTRKSARHSLKENKIGAGVAGRGGKIESSEVLDDSPPTSNFRSLVSIQEES
jgi:hypothetical protein